MRRKYLVALNKSEKNTPIFVVPAAGMTPFSFAKLAQSLSAEWPVFTFQFAGLMNKHQRHESIEEMAAAFIEEIKLVQPNGPYIIAGHCWGGIVALEIASQLESVDDYVSDLVLLESLPPIHILPEPVNEQITGKSPGKILSDQQHADLSEKALKLTLDLMFQQLSRLPEKLVEQFGLFGYQQIEIGDRYLANKINARITLIRTNTHDFEVFQNWKQLSTSCFNEEVIAGGSFSMLEQPYLQELVERIGSVLLKPESS